MHPRTFPKKGDARQSAARLGWHGWHVAIAQSLGTTSAQDCRGGRGFEGLWPHRREPQSPMGPLNDCRLCSRREPTVETRSFPVEFQFFVVRRGGNGHRKKKEEEGKEDAKGCEEQEFGRRGRVKRGHEVRSEHQADSIEERCGMDGSRTATENATLAAEHRRTRTVMK